MTAVPEPLRSFDAVTIGDALDRVDPLVAAYPSARAAGHVLPNVAEAMQEELTCHSNTLEGNTLTLRVPTNPVTTAC